MRKIKKINGYLVVKFNDRELRDWADTALGNYGVIDIELYTGCLAVDRSVMEYDSAETLEEAIEQARGLESEIDVIEPVATYTVIKETDEAIEEETVDPKQLIEVEKDALETRISGVEGCSIGVFDAANELRGFETALVMLGLVEPNECSDYRNVFKRQLDRHRAKRSITVTLTPHKQGDGGCLTMPLRSNVPNPKNKDWALTSCPVCGAECWENSLAREAMAAEPNLRAACTACALKAGLQKKTEPPVEEATPCSECPLPGKQAVSKSSKSVEEIKDSLMKMINDPNFIKDCVAHIDN